jgi:hypothetical protein
MSTGLTDYLGLITSQHRGKPKFMAFLGMLLQYIDDVDQCAASINPAFNVDSAVGMQLDTVGQWVGINRTVTFQPTGGASPILDDDMYRVAIKAKVVKNHWDGTLDMLVDAWSVLFPDFQIIITDNEDMTVTALVVGDPSQMMQDLIINGYIIPKPEGVRINIYAGDQPYFGFDFDDSLISGFDVGHFV